MSRFLLDSSFLIDLLNEAASNRRGAAMRWLASHERDSFWISPVTFAEVIEGANDPAAVRDYLSRFRWQGIGHSQADRTAQFQRRQGQRLGENDAWQVGVAQVMDAVIVGHDAAFERLGSGYANHRDG